MTQDPVEMGYSINGMNLGPAFRVSKSDLAGRALFPHVLTKNQHFSVNFGQLPSPMRQLIPGYIPIGQVSSREVSISDCA